MRFDLAFNHRPTGASLDRGGGNPRLSRQPCNPPTGRDRLLFSKRIHAITPLAVY